MSGKILKTFHIIISLFISIIHILIIIIFIIFTITIFMIIVIIVILQNNFISSNINIVL